MSWRKVTRSMRGSKSHHASALMCAGHAELALQWQCRWRTQYEHFARCSAVTLLHAASGLFRQWAMGRHSSAQYAGSSAHGSSIARYLSTSGATGSSSESTPISASWRIVDAENILVVEPIGMSDSGVSLVEAA